MAHAAAIPLSKIAASSLQPWSEKGPSETAVAQARAAHFSRTDLRNLDKGSNQLQTLGGSFCSRWQGSAEGLRGSALIRSKMLISKRTASSEEWAKIMRSSRAGRGAGVVTMGIRAVENFDTTFELQPECQEVLVSFLQSDQFCGQVSKQPGVPDDCKWKFTGELFQPVPWSPNTKHGMPQEFEKYLADKEKYVIINVPPPFMFKAKIFKPSRLCAVYQREESS